MFGPSDELAIDPVPGRRGPYEVCTRIYDVETAGGHQLVGKIYAPVTDERGCTALDRQFNLVVIAHADGASNSYLSYDALGEHLASNAFIVVSIHRYPDFPQLGAWETFDEHLTRNLDYIYNQSGVRDFLADRVALIGHSAGGKSVIENAGAVAEFGKTLAAIVTMSPTVNGPAVTFNGVTPALLSIHVMHDSDLSAYGSPLPTGPGRSGLKVYDEAGITGNPDSFALEKDMLFVSTGGHYYQASPFVLAYVNAYLQAHLNGHAANRRFFKRQAMPPTLIGSLDPVDLLQMHEDVDRLTLDDFEDFDRLVNRMGGQNLFEGAGFSFVQEGVAWELDTFSPHTSGIMYLGVDEKQGGSAPTIRFWLTDPENLTDRRYLGFRIGQSYHPQLNPAGTDQTIAVRLVSKVGAFTVPLGDYGPAIRFPQVSPSPSVAPPVAPPGVVAANAQTKNAMRSYLISLRDFEGVDLKKVTEVQLIFSGVSPSTVFSLDDLAFYRF